MNGGLNKIKYKSGLMEAGNMPRRVGSPKSLLGLVGKDDGIQT